MMKVTDLLLTQLREAPWNVNRMDEAMLARLRASIKRFGVVENLVVRPIGEDVYEVLSGNQRLKLLKEMGFPHAPCVVVDLDDAHARLLAQALNHIHGQDDLGLQAELLRSVLEKLTESELLDVLPETAESLKSLASMGRETIARYLQNWERARLARLKHLQFQLTAGQLEIVEEALAKVLPVAKDSHGDNPNTRGTALYLLCRDYLEKRGEA